MSTGPEGYRTFDDLEETVSDYESFYTVAEHRARDEALAAGNDHVEFLTLGESSDGNEIWALRVGEGTHTAFLFGAPHPNEPIGSMTVDYVSHRLAEDDEFRESFDYQFVLLKTIDVDGTLLNQGWFDGPYTTTNYGQNFYRPASYEQVEWTFPMEYGEYEFDAPLPETEILMDVMETYEPEFVYSLHNTGFGGCYYYLSHRLDEIFDDLRAIPTEQGVPLHRGENETPWSEKFDDAIFEVLSAERQYDFYAENTDEADPEAVLDSGAGSYDYARRQNAAAFELTTELPYFYDPRIDSDAPTDRTRRDVYLESVDSEEELFTFLQSQYERVDGELPENRLKRAVEETIEKTERRISAKRSWANSAEELAEDATEAHQLDVLTIHTFYHMLYVGMFLRLLDQAHMAAADSDAAGELAAAKTAVEARFHEINAELREDLDYEPIPISRLVTIQARAGFLCLDYLQESGAFE